jgi:glucose-6-phosphate isomerase
VSSFDFSAIHFDFSRHSLGWPVLLSPFHESAFDAYRLALYSGAKVNVTEQRAANHVHLRSTPEFAARFGMGEVQATFAAQRRQAYAWANRVCNGEYTHIIHIGVGGSYAGPKAVHHALSLQRKPVVPVHFALNPDPLSLQAIADACPAESTLLVMCSKSFGTEEVLHNTRWLLEWKRRSGVPDSAAMHDTLAITARPDRALEFGVERGRILQFDETIGGRFSLWSACGFPVMCAFGTEAFDELLAGAHAADEAFINSPVERNAPLWQAAASWHYRSVQQLVVLAVLLYGDVFSEMRLHIMQLVMESLGKSARLDGGTCDAGGPFLIVDTGTACQHTFLQMLQQGASVVPVEVLTLAAQPSALLANSAAGLAQSLTSGGTVDGPVALAGHLRCSGQRPVTCLSLADASATSLGAYLAVLEHRVFAESFLSQTNPFDQFGVELAKAMRGPAARLIA